MLKFGQWTVAKKSFALHLDPPPRAPQVVGGDPHWAPIQNSITDGDRKLKFGQWTVGKKPVGFHLSPHPAPSGGMGLLPQGLHLKS